MTDPFRIAFICTGNRFRSPLAAAVFRRESHALRLPAQIESFGTADIGDVAALPEAVELAAAAGVDLSAHRARTIARGRLDGFDLVVGFERFHLASAVVDGGAPRGSAYTLPEIVELLEQALPVEADGDRSAQARALLARTAELREVGPTFSGVPEIDDPLGRALRAQRAIATQVVDLTRRLARGLAPGA